MAAVRPKSVIKAKSAIRVYGRFVLVMSHDVTWPRHRKRTFHALVIRNAGQIVRIAGEGVAAYGETRLRRDQDAAMMPEEMLIRHKQTL